MAARKTTRRRPKARPAAKKRPPRRSGPRSGKSRSRRRGPGILRRALTRFFVLLVVGLAAWVAWEGATVYFEFEGRRWSLPARVYASPTELYAGKPLSTDEFVELLGTLGYRRADGSTVQPASWWRQGRSVRVMTRGFRFWDGMADASVVQVDFGSGQVRRLRTADGMDVGVLRLDPVEIGSIFPSHGEDRLVLVPEQVPQALAEALIAVEDRKFEQHYGVDPVAILRAAWVNLRAGEVRQGGSTITQQLVKNYLLDNRQTLWRKMREAVMAVWVDALYEKDEILTAYINEIYLGQDGRRSIHGFGLGSRFYFGRPLEELDVSELALLVALVRGPSWYNPWRQPERALARRDLVLTRMAEHGTITRAEADAASARPLGVAAPDERLGYYPAYLDLVRRQLATDYRAADLESEGLRVFTALEPERQRQAQRALSEGIDRLETGRAEAAGLEGAVVVTRPQTGEVLAVVGSRRSGFDGFNRALLAARPIGSLVKPAVYLSAIETGRYHLGSLLQDEPIDVPLSDGTVWSPRNFSGDGEGEVTLLRSLAESLNLATVSLGMDVGVDTVAETLGRLGFDRDIKRFPSLLLGAVEMTPLEVARLYGALAGGGFSTPLRAVREIVDSDGQALERFGIEVTAAADPAAVRQVTRALEVAMIRGTGRSARGQLPEGLRVAGKTGTSNAFRDSWFAGFTGDNLAIVWLGHDDARTTGLSGARGALTVWSAVMAEAGATDFRPPPVPGLAEVLIDFGTGELVSAGCGDPVRVPVPEDARLPVRPACGIETRNLAERALDWLKRLGN